MYDPQHEGQRWLSQAGTDLDAARTLRDRFPALACFHAQQAAEKALKAVLYGSGQRQVLGHSVASLAEAVERLDPSFALLRVEAGKLDRFYIPTRYPNGLPAGTEPGDAFDHADADAAITTAATVAEHVAARLGDTEGE